MDITYVKAVFGSLRKTRTRAVYRDDHDLILQLVGVKGLPVHFQAHFANSEYGTAVVMMGSDGEVSIPNTLLATGLPIYCWILVEQGISGAVRYSIQIPVRQKARPDGTITPEQADIISQAISALNDAGTSAQEAADSAAQSAEYVAGVKDDLYDAIDRVGVLEEAKDTTLEAASNAEAWAIGNRGGSAVPSTDPAYHNNSKYYAEQAAESARTLTIDSTLSQSGQAADAKATGRIKDDLTAVVEYTNKPVLAFIQGRYITIGDPVGTTSSSETTVSTTTSIPYTDVAYNIFVKSGWKLAFPSFTSGNLSSAAKTFIAGPATVTIEDIKANAYNAGESFAIMVRTDPEASLPVRLPVSGFSAKDAFVFIPVNITVKSIISETNPDLNSYTDAGVYYITSEAINSIKSNLPNAPKTIIGGILEVHNTPFAVFQKYTDWAEMYPEWVRVIGSSWRYYSNRFGMMAKMLTVGNSGLNFNTTLSPGMYNVPSGTEVANAPSGYLGTNRHQLISFYAALSNYALSILIGQEGTWVKRDGLEWHKLAYTNEYKKVTWVAIGDSITDGRYSYVEDGTAKTGTDHTAQYNYIASQILNMNPVIEYGYGGMGWLHVANDKTTYLTDVLDMDFGSPDLITVCLGVNDRGAGTLGDTSSTANDGTISGAIRNCCVTLATKYPTAQIVFFTPLNASSSGTIDTKWSRQGASKNNLDDIADLIKHWCNFYGFKVIDLLTESPVNSINITTMLPDGLHPSKTAHSIIGHYIAGVLPIRN